MADSIRELIFAALETVLRSIPGIGDVTRGKLDPLSVRSHPAACVAPGTDTVVEYLGTLVDRQLTVYTFLWIKSQTNIDKEIEAFLPKVQKALAAQGEPDQRLGGLVKDITETAVHEPLPLNDDETDAGVILEHAVIYRVARLDPYSQI